MKREIALFSGRLAALLGGGLSLSRSLELLAGQTGNIHLREAIQHLRDDVEGGLSFSIAVSRRPGFFSVLDLGLLESGEASGDLVAPLREIARLQELEIDTTSRIRTALIYPAALLAMVACVALFLTLVVIPRFNALFEELGQQVPWPTRLLINGASGLRHTWSLWLVGLAGLFIWWDRNQGPNREKMLAQIRKLSWCRRVMDGFLIERWSRMMAALLRGGFNPVEAFQISEKMLSINYFKQISHDLYEGRSLSDSLAGSPLFPPMVRELLAVGEESNSLESSLERISQSFQQETQAQVQLALKFLEPALIVAMGGVVGFVALALLLPIFEMSGGLK